jgi:glycosyltransferase involved in cell wall biosynthesis
MRVFHLATDLGPTATGARLELLFGGTQATIGVLDARSSFRPLPFTPLPLRPYLDVHGWRRIQKAIDAFDPNIIHAWGRRAAEMLNVIRTRARIFKTFDEPESFLSKRIGTRVDIPPIVAEPLKVDRDALRASLGYSPEDRVVLVADRFASAEPARRAVWAMDLLKPSSPAWKLALLGDGPARARVEQFAARLSAGESVCRFLGVRDSRKIVHAADVVWHTRTGGGAHFLLEAAAAGVPVIRSAVPSEIIRATAKLFADESLRRSEAESQRALAKGHAVEPVRQALLARYLLN